MFFYRVVDKDGKVVVSRTNGQAGVYTSYESADRARRQYKNQRWYAKFGPFTIQQSSHITWDSLSE